MNYHVSFLLVFGICCCVNLVRAAAVGDIVLINLGCWKENTAIPDGEVVLGGNYQQRGNAIQDCARFAADRGYDVFGVQDNGKCVTSSTAKSLYKANGKAYNCPAHGRGAPWVNQMYEIKRVYYYLIRHLGCWKENTAIPDVELTLGGNYQQRTEALHKCYNLALSFGYEVFALQDNGKCVTSSQAKSLYKANGHAYNCPHHGRGAPWVNQVYETSRIVPIVLKDLGCWKENTAIPDASRDLGGNYQQRKDAIQVCANYAASKGYKVFGVQDNGKCVTSSNAQSLYRLKGRSTNCPPHGRGAPWVNQVYQISGYKILTY